MVYVLCMVAMQGRSYYSIHFDIKEAPWRLY